MIAPIKNWLKRHWPPLRIGTILFGTLLFVAALPGVGAVFLRVYENTLVQQTESELIAQGAVLAAAYRAGWGGASSNEPRPEPEPPQIDLRSDPVLPMMPRPTPGATADPRALAATAALAPVVADASAVTVSMTRLLDRNGVVAVGRRDRGRSYAALPEVVQALKGRSATVLRAIDSDPFHLNAPLELLSRAATIRVHHVRPVIAGGRVVGAVMMVGTPRNLFVGIAQDGGKIALGVVLIFLTLVVLAGLLSRSIARPILKLTAATENVARGAVYIPEPPETAAIEIRELYRNFAVMAERIEQRTRYLRDFAAAVSHEFKTPLTGIRGAIELLRDHDASMAPEERQRFLTNAEADAARLAQLVSRLLELARADMAGRGDAVTEVAPVLARVSDALRGDGFAVHLEIASGLPQAAAPLTTLEAALTTLVENSRQAGASDVTIRAFVRGEMLMLDVADNGGGIAAADRERIFEPFFTTRRASGGTGLGLSIVRSLVEAAAGTVSLVETGGGGTRFELCFPQVNA